MKHAKKIIIIVLMILLLVGGYVWGYIKSGLNFIPAHFHANFIMYINGERVDFSGDEFSEDVAGCSLSGEIFPEGRTHLHENNPDTIHIHHEGVAWGHFFANNGFTFGESFISQKKDTITLNESEIERSAQEDIFINSGERRLYFILNGEEVIDPYNELIESKDKLLIIYGLETQEERMKIFETVSSNAGEFNEKYDPGSCGGTNESGIIALFKDIFISKDHTH